MNLTEAFSKIEDFRRAEGRRYPLMPMLLIIVMSIVCGYPRYREIARFARANGEKLAEFFCLGRKEMPSHVTIRSIVMNSDFGQIRRAFEKWCGQHVSVGPGEMLSVDGKAIASTVSDYDRSYQDFVSLVSVFSQKQGQVIGFDRLRNGKGSEIPKVEELIRLLDLENVVFTMDALHCQKKTLRTVVETDNDYIVKVKNNQPKLLAAIRQGCGASEPVDVFETDERSRGRSEHREVSVFEPPCDTPEGWAGLARVICVRRSFKTGGDHHASVSYYISSVISDSAELFAGGIRGHWHIENRLHWVKDVVMNEDSSGIRDMNAAANMSAFRNIAINIVRGDGFDSVKAASIFFVANIRKLFDLIRT